MPPRVKTRGKKAQAADNSTSASISATKAVRKRVVKTPSKDGDNEVLNVLKTLAARMSQLEQQVTQCTASVDSPATSVRTPTRRRRQQSPDAVSSDIDEEVRLRVNRRLKSLQQSSPDDDASSDILSASDSSPTPKKKAGKKSGRARDANCRIKVEITWPHELIYDDEGNACRFDVLTVPQFVHGFLLITAQAKTAIAPHMTAVLQEAMEDAQRYPWSNVRACVAIFLQQIEMGRAKWADASIRGNLRRTHIWNAPVKVTRAKTRSPSRPADESHTGRQRWNNNRFEAKPGTKVCSKFNNEFCNSAQDHPDRLHICAFCLRKDSKAFPHPQRNCRRQASALNGPAGGHAAATGLP